LACPGRTSAIEGGANLPVTLKKQQAEENAKASSAITKFVQGAAFDNWVLNQMLVIWLIMSAQPWQRIEDNILGISFNYTCRGVKLYSRTWAATKAHSFYTNLQKKVMNTLTVR
jgi:hypothetical protein